MQKMGKVKFVTVCNFQKGGIYACIKYSVYILLLKLCPAANKASINKIANLILYIQCILYIVLYFTKMIRIS